MNPIYAMSQPLRKHTNDEWMDYYATIYRINERTLMEIRENAWSHPTVVPEDVERDMRFVWDQMVELIPEEHSFNVLRLVYG